MSRLLAASLVAASLASTATAQTAQGAELPWLISGNVSVARTGDSGEPVLRAGALAVERSLGLGRIGFSIGASEGDASPPPQIALTTLSASTFQASAWFSSAVGDYDWTFVGGYGRQTFEGVATVSSAIAPPSPQGLAAAIDSEVTSGSIAVVVSRMFGETWKLTPSIGVSYDTTEGRQNARLANLSSAGGTVLSSAEAITGSFGLYVSGPLNDRLTLTGGGVFYATDNGAAQSFRFGRENGARPIAAQSGDAAQWGELSVGLSWLLSETTDLSLGAGSTIGRDTETAFASLGAGLRF